jgi:hypothetical protein
VWREMRRFLTLSMLLSGDCYRFTELVLVEATAEAAVTTEARNLRIAPPATGIELHKAPVYLPPLRTSQALSTPLRPHRFDRAATLTAKFKDIP